MDDVPLMLPLNTDGLVVGFFDCGVYQETLGGRMGSKHCLLPEGPEVVLDECSGVQISAADELGYTYAPGQTAAHILGNLGYG